ncbi:MAG TPA: imidazolonepropionase [Gemmatimonadaceae bacterium]|jgi:imidazolonepropionase|nr:imidazolonepropionase [Gemmatimonadaceae bacterium]
MPASLLFVNAAQVVTCAGPGRARRGDEMRDAGVLTDAAVLVRGDTIAEVGPAAELDAKYPDAERVDCRGGVLTPGLVDSHTHAIFGAPRYEEQGMRAAGVAYMEIARAGGGIHSSVRSVREASEDELTDLARRRLLRLASYGTTTVEVKSGYGLRVEDELKQLRVIARLADELPLRLVPTWLGAHEIPPEARVSLAARADYVRMLVEEMLPRVVSERLAIFADVFCEPGVFTIEETRYVLEAAKAAGLKLKLHADELEPSGAAELAASLGATSADHLAAISRTGVDALATSGTVATLLPGTMLFLGKGRQAPARALLEAGASVALATDFNPGTSPTVNLPLILTLGVSQLRMSPTEAILAATVNGAAALGLADRVGQISAGYSADLALFEMEDVRELPYWYGERRCMSTWLRGKTCDEYELAVS